MENNVYLLRKHLQAYFQCSEETARKRYRQLLDKAGKDMDQKLTMFDIQRIEKVPIEYVKKRIFELA